MADLYALWVSTGKEHEVLARLAAVDGITDTTFPEANLWERRGGEWRKKRRALLPGYIFIRCGMTQAIYDEVKALPQVIGWLGKEDALPHPLSREDEQTVRTLASGSYCALFERMEISLRQRRGYGTVRIDGQVYRIPFNTHDDKQAEAPRGDASPMAAETE